MFERARIWKIFLNGLATAWRFILGYGIKKPEYPIIQPTYVNMSELATMAALKITNSINQHYQQQYQEPLTPIQSHTPNMPFSAQSPQSDSSSVTTTNNNLTATTNTNTNNTNTTNSMTTNPESPDISSTATDDTLSRQASVDAAPSSYDYDDCAIHDTNQTLSSSTSGMLFGFSTILLTSKISKCFRS